MPPWRCACVEVLESSNAQGPHLIYFFCAACTHGASKMAPGAAAASGDGADWVRVDDLLERASAQLQVGEMVQCETFSLFEAMSAVELGNAKMDAGASSQHLDGPEELIGKGVAPLTLSPTQQLAVMERLLVLEASHYCFGTPLAATVYSSVYMMLGGSRCAMNRMDSQCCTRVRARARLWRLLTFGRGPWRVHPAGSPAPCRCWRPFAKACSSPAQP